MCTKIILLFSSFTLLLACKNKEDASPLDADHTEPSLVVRPAFQLAFDSLKLEGSVLIFDPQAHTYYSNDFPWARKGHLPASTFKIPNSIIALETGVIEDENVILPWDGTTRSVSNWNQDLAFADAFAYSCVPCYQRIARDIGRDRMRKQLDKIEYPGISFQPEEIDMFWLAGDSRINQFEQVEFLQRLRNEELPISINTARTLRNIMVIDSTDAFVLRGKTGWSQADEKDNGWFVGFVERPSKNKTATTAEVLYFATNIEPKAGTSIDAFIAGRRGVTEAAIRSLNWP